MKISISFKYIYILFALLTVMACGGGGSSSTPASPNISLSETSYDFSGVVLYNDEEREFRITNTGNADLTVGSISGLANPFTIVTGFADTCSGTTLSRGETCSFRARFAPVAQGTFADQISISSNDPDGAATISLTGEGYGYNVWINSASADASCNVTVEVTVMNPENIMDIIDDLLDSDFYLYVNGNIQTVNTISHLHPAPVSLVLAIDWSISEQDVIDDIRAAANAFIDQLTSDDKAAICKFNSVIGFEPVASGTFYDGTSQLLNDYINDASFTFVTGTYLYDAVYNSIMRAAQGSLAKKAVVVLSDGEDTGSPNHSLNDVIAYAAQQGIPVFTIYYVDPAYPPSNPGNYGNPEIMEQLAEETGGQYYNGTTANLTDVYQQIANTLSNKYTIGFNVSGCSAGTATLDVRADDGSLHGQDSTTITFP